MKLNKKQLLDLKPCADGLQFAENCKFDSIAIWDTCPRGDWLIWLLRRTGQMDKPMAVDIAIACAEHVLCFFETKNPQDARPRKAIQAAINWVKDPSEEKQKAVAASAAAAADADAAAADKPLRPALTESGSPPNQAYPCLCVLFLIRSRLCSPHPLRYTFEPTSNQSRSSNFLTPPKN
jgi:hypothetical protein